MSPPYKSMNDDTDKKPTSTALWRQWRPNKMVSGLRPRLNRRRRRSAETMSCPFPISSSVEPNATLDQDEEMPATQQRQEEEEPRSPPSVHCAEAQQQQEEEEITTPRSAQQQDISFDSHYSLTPPTALAPPLVVSAKRLGSEIRKNHSKRRKGRMRDKENTSNQWEDEPEERLPPVEHLEPQERTQRYWQWCYGDKTEPIPQSSWSASRAPPAKSCLSSKKAPMVRAVTLETPTLNRLSITTFETPSNSPDDDTVVVVHKSTSSKSVQFGTPSAAEYDKDGPPKELTPMPSEVAKERFPLTAPVQEEATEETKCNSATLAEWDNDFDSYLNDDDDEEEDDELETMLFSRKSRRSSGFFSPDAASLLLPSSSSPDEDDDSTMMQQQEQDYCCDVNMASLAVRSPVDADMEGTITTLQQKEQFSWPQESMDTTPPSDCQLASVHSTGGAFVPDATMNHPREQVPMIPSRQLHGALERCARDEHDNIMTSLLQNPQSDMEWSTGQLFVAMARYNTLVFQDTRNESTFEEMFEFLSSLDSQSMVRAHLSNEFDKFSSNDESSSDAQPPVSSDVARAVWEWESEKYQVGSLETLLQQMHAFGASIQQELERLETLDLQQRHVVMKNQQGENDEDNMAELERIIQVEQAERDLAVARLHHHEALRDLYKAAPFDIFQCLALCNIASFSVERVSPSRVELSFSCAATGPRPCICWDAKDGIGSLVLPESSRETERAPTIPSDHVAALFYKHMLFVDDYTIRPSILHHCMSTNLSQTVLSLSLLMGRLDIALVDLSMVTTKSYIASVSLQIESENVVLVSISFHDNLLVDFSYDFRHERTCCHVMPTCVRVIHAGLRMTSLEGDAHDRLAAAGTWPCLERICDALFLASCV